MFSFPQRFVIDLRIGVALSLVTLPLVETDDGAKAFAPVNARATAKTEIRAILK